MPEKLLTLEDVAERLMVQVPTVRGWLRTGRMRGVKAGRLWRVPEGEVDGFLAQPGGGLTERDVLGLLRYAVADRLREAGHSHHCRIDYRYPGESWFADAVIYEGPDPPRIPGEAGTLVIEVKKRQPRPLSMTWPVLVIGLDGGVDLLNATGGEFEAHVTGVVRGVISRALADGVAPCGHDTPNADADGKG